MKTRQRSQGGGARNDKTLLTGRRMAHTRKVKDSRESSVFEEHNARPHLRMCRLLTPQPHQPSRLHQTTLWEPYPNHRPRSASLSQYYKDERCVEGRNALRT